jgi:hypothetical protein
MENIPTERQSKVHSLGFYAAVLLVILVYGSLGWTAWFIGTLEDAGELGMLAFLPIVVILGLLWKAFWYFSVMVRNSNIDGRSYSKIKIGVLSLLGGLGYLIYTAENYKNNNQRSLDLQDSPLLAIVPQGSPLARGILAIWAVASAAFFFLAAYTAHTTKASLEDGSVLQILGASLLSAVWSGSRYWSLRTGKANPLAKDMGGLASFLVLILFIVVFGGLILYGPAYFNSR